MVVPTDRDMVEDREWVFYVSDNERFDGDHEGETYFSLWMEYSFESDDSNGPVSSSLREDEKYPEKNERFPVYAHYPFGGWFSQDELFDTADKSVNPSDLFWRGLWKWMKGEYTDELADTLDEKTEPWEAIIFNDVVEYTIEDELSSEMELLLFDAVDKASTFGERVELYQEFGIGDWGE